MLYKNLGQGGSGMHGDEAGTAAHYLKQIEGTTRVTVAGAAASTDIAVAGTLTGDRIMSATAYPNAGGVPVVITDLTVTSDGNVQTATDTSSHTLLVEWAKANP